VFSNKHLQTVGGVRETRIGPRRICEVGFAGVANEAKIKLK